MTGTAHWLFLSFLTLLFWGVWAALPRGLSSTISGLHQQTLSTAGLLPVLALMALAWRRRWHAARWRDVAISFTAGLFGVAGNIFYFEALNASAAAAAVVPLVALYPVVTVVLAAAFLGERPSAAQMSGIALALAAIYVFNPLGGGADLKAVSSHALAPIALYGAAGCLQKVSTRSLSGEIACFWFLAAFLPLAGWCVARDPTLRWDHPAADWVILAGIGLTYALGNWTLLAAFAAGGKATVVAPLTGLYYIVSLPILVVALGEKIGAREGWGIALSVAAVVGLSLERRPAAGAARIETK